jgi:hypothetical protein
MATITTGVRLTPYGYKGMVTVRDGAVATIRSTGIMRQTREDALFDAAGLATDMALEASPVGAKESHHA